MRVGPSKSVPHVQIEILFPIQPQDFLHHRQRHFLGRRFPSPSVKQPSKPELFITLSPVPHLPVADPRPQNDFLYFHRPLHRGLRVREHASHGLLPSPPEKRTHHLLSQPDISCANDTALVRELEKSFASNTLLKLYWLPTINAAIELNHGNSAQALMYLETAAPYELGSAGTFRSEEH